MATVMLTSNYEYRPFGNGYSVRVVQLPIYTYVKDLDDVELRLQEAIELFRSGFSDDAAFLEYLRANGIEPIVVPAEVPARVWTRASNEIRCLVAVA